MDEFTSEQELSVVYEEETVDLLPTEFNLRSEDWPSTSEYLCESESVLQGELCESLVEEIVIDQDNANYLTELGDPVIDDSLVYVLSGPVPDYTLEESPFEVVQPLMMESPMNLELIPPGMEASPEAPVQFEEEEDITKQEASVSERECRYSECEKSEIVISDVEVLNSNEFIGPMPLPQPSILYPPMQPILPKTIALHLNLEPPPPPPPTTPPRASTTLVKDSRTPELTTTSITPVKTSVLGKEQIKKRLQSFSLMKQGIQAVPIKKALIKNPAKIQIQVQKDAYDEDGNLYEPQIIVVQKPKKQVPANHGQRARAVIDEIERIKKEEQAIYEEKLSYVKRSMQVAQKMDDKHTEKRERKYSNREYFHNRSRYSSESDSKFDKRRSFNLSERYLEEIQYKQVKHKEVKHKEGYHKEDKLYKDEKLHKEEKLHRMEKPHKEEKMHKEEKLHKDGKLNKDEKQLEEREEFMPLHWKEFKEKDFDFKKISTLKEKIFKNCDKEDKRVQKRSQERGDKIIPQIVAKTDDPFDTPSWPRQSIAVTAKDETSTYSIAPELVKFTEQLPSISWSNKQAAAIGFLQNRKQIIDQNPHKRTELMMKIIENNTGTMDKDYGEESTQTGHWYPKENYLEEAKPEYVALPSDALLVLSEIYEDPIDELIEEKINSKIDSSKKVKYDVEEKNDKSLKKKSKKKKSKSKHKKSKSRSKSKDKYGKNRNDDDRSSMRKKKKDKRDKSKTEDKSKSPENKVDKLLDLKIIVSNEEDQPKEEDKPKVDTPKDEKVKEDIPNEEKPIKNKSETNTPNTDEYRSNWESDEELLQLIRVDQSNPLDKAWEIDELDDVRFKRHIVNPQTRHSLSLERKKKFENDEKRCNSSYLLDLELEEKTHNKRETDLKTELENKRLLPTRFVDQKKSRTSSKFEETLYSDVSHRSFNKGYEFEDRGEYTNPIIVKDCKLDRPPKHDERFSRFEPLDNRRSRDFETRDQKQQNSRDRLRHNEEKGRKSPEMHIKKYKEQEMVLDKRVKQYNENVDDKRGKQYNDNMEDKRGKQYNDNMDDKRGKQYSEIVDDKRGKQYIDNMEDKRGKQYNDNMDDKRGKQYNENLDDKRGKQYFDNMEDKRGKQYNASMDDKRGKQYNENMDDKRGKQYIDNMEDKRGKQYNDNMDDKRGKQYNENMDDKRGKQYIDNMEDKRGKQYNVNMDDKRGKQYNEIVDDKRGKQYIDNMEDKRGKQYNDNMDDKRGKQYNENMDDKRGKQYIDNMEDKRGKQYNDNMDDKRGKQYNENMDDKRGKQYIDNMVDKRGKQYNDNMDDKRGKQYNENMDDKRGKQYIDNMEDKRGKQYNDNMDNKRGKHYNDDRSFRKSSDWDKKSARDCVKDSRLSNERSRRSIELEHSRKSRGEAEKDNRIMLKHEENKRSAIPKYRDSYNHEQEVENTKRYSSSFSNYHALEESRRENKHNKKIPLETSDIISVWSSDEDIYTEVKKKSTSENQKRTEEELYLNYNKRPHWNADEEFEKKKVNKLDGVLQLLGKSKERQSKWDEEEEDKCQVLEKVLEIRQSNLLDISKNVKKLEKRRKSKDSDDSKASRSSRKGKKSKKQSKENKKRVDSEPEERQHISDKDDNKKTKKVRKTYKIESKVTLHYSDLEDNFEENTKPQKTEKNDAFSVENEKFSKYKSKVKIDYSDFDLCLVGIKEKLEDIENKSIPSNISTPSYAKNNLELSEILEDSKGHKNEHTPPEKLDNKSHKTEFEECTSAPVRDEFLLDDSNTKSLTPSKKILQKLPITTDASSKLVSEYEEFMKAVSFEEPKTPEEKEPLKIPDIQKLKNDEEISKKSCIEDDDDALSSIDSTSDDDTSDEEESSDSSSDGSEDSEDMSPSHTSREEMLQTVAKIKTEKLSDDEDKQIKDIIHTTIDTRKRIYSETLNQYATNVVVKTEIENIAKKAKTVQDEDKTIIDWEKNYTYPNKITSFPLIQSKYSNPMFGISDMILPENIPLPSEQVVPINKPILTTNIEVTPIVSTPISIPQNISSIVSSSPQVEVTPIYNTIIPIRLLTPEPIKQLCTEIEQQQFEKKTPTRSIVSLVYSSDMPPNFETAVINYSEIENSEPITLSRKRQCQWNMNLTPVKKPLLQRNVFGEQESDDDLSDKILNYVDKPSLDKDKLNVSKKIEEKKRIDSVKDDKTKLESHEKHFVTEIDKNKLVDTTKAHDKEKDKMEKERSSSRFSKDRTEKELKKDGSKKDELRNDKRERSRERQINKDSYRDNRRRLDRPENRSDRSDRRLSERKTYPKGGRRFSRDRSPPPRGRRDRSLDRNRSRDRERSLDQNKSRDRDRSRERERNSYKSGKESDPKYNRNSSSYKKLSRSPTPTKSNASGNNSDAHNYNDDSLLNFRQTDTDFSVSSMDIVHSPINSPLDGFKRSLADSTISDSELLTQQITPEESNEPSPGYQLHSQHYYPPVAQQILPASAERHESPCSPKRISLDDRINLVLGIEKEPPKPIDTVCTRGPFPTTNHPPSYHQDPYNTYNRSDYDLYNQDSYTYSQNNQYQHYYNTLSGSLSAQPAKENNVKVLQVGNVIQVVPTEQPLPTTSCSSSSNLIPVPKAPEAPPKVVQVGNMLQIVPVPILETPARITSPEIAVVSSPLAPEKPGTKSADQLMLERKADKEKRRLDREARRTDKEKKRKEKEKRRQLKIKMKTENMIKRALMLETGETDLDISNMDHDVSAEILDVSVPSAWPPMNPLQAVPLPKVPGKGILVSHGFREKEESFRDDTEPRKVVKFADGICPGEGTSPSAGEELPSPPPPPRKLPKEKRYKKTKLNSKNKKKVKVKIIRTQPIQSDDSDTEDLLPPPPPPPGSPPPHLWPPRIITNINNIHPQLTMVPNTVYPPPTPHYAPNVPPPQIPHSTGYHPPPQMAYPPAYPPPIRQQMPIVMGQMPPIGPGPNRGLHPPVLPIPGGGPMGGVAPHGLPHHGPPVQLGPPGPPMFHH